MGTALGPFVAALASGVVDAQLRLDDAGRDSIDDFQYTGIPPTVLAWSRMRVSVPLGVRLRAKSAAEGTSEVYLSVHASGRLTIGLRYLLSPQGVDDPHPALPAPDGRQDRLS